MKRRKEEEKDSSRDYERVGAAPQEVPGRRSVRRGAVVAARDVSEPALAREAAQVSLRGKRYKRSAVSQAAARPAHRRRYLFVAGPPRRAAPERVDLTRGVREVAEAVPRDSDDIVKEGAPTLGAAPATAGASASMVVLKDGSDVVVVAPVALPAGADASVAVLVDGGHAVERNVPGSGAYGASAGADASSVVTKDGGDAVRCGAPGQGADGVHAGADASVLVPRDGGDPAEPGAA